MFNDAGACFARHQTEGVVFRAVVLSIVLALAIGPNAVVLCAAWCHPEETKSSACRHPDATMSPLVTGENNCRTVPAVAAAFVREEAKRGSPTVAVPQSAPLPHSLFAPAPSDTSLTNASTSLAVISPPLRIALRI
jgi:hypothetical protein